MNHVHGLLLAFSVRRPPGAESLVVTHSDRVSLVYFT